VIRPARPDDVPAIVGLIVDLADYERARHEVHLDATMLHAALFGPTPAVFAHVVDVAAPDSTDGDIVGVALWFLSFSTWLGHHGIYLEDLYVRQEHRGAGHGRALLATLARIAVDRGYGRVEWAVLDWNEPALGFYRALGAVAQDEWTVQRLTGEALHRVATDADRYHPAP
jgi:GNAT superfamily N-acetyltransferase